jgi:hypothetical protein
MKWCGTETGICIDDCNQIVALDKFESVAVFLRFLVSIQNPPSHE